MPAKNTEKEARLRSCRRSKKSTHAGWIFLFLFCVSAKKQIFNFSAYTDRFIVQHARYNHLEKGKMCVDKLC